jgi:hypothetical protein
LNKLGLKAKLTKNLTQGLISVAEDCEKVLIRVRDAGMISEAHHLKFVAAQRNFDEMMESNGKENLH